MQSNLLWPVNERFPRFSGTSAVDVGVIGGGIAGISAAYHLKNAGYKVALLERNEVGNGATGASSGILYYGSGTNFMPAIKLFGKEKARFLWKETATVIEETSKLIKEYGIDCGFRNCGVITAAKTEQEAKELEAEQDELKECGISAKLLSTAQLKEIFPKRPFLAGLKFDACVQIHPARFASGLAKAAGIDVYENSEAIEWEELDDGVTVKTKYGMLKCSKLVMATNIKPLFGLETNFYKESSVIIASGKMETVKDVWPQDTIIQTMEEDYDMIYTEDGRCMLELYRLKNVDLKLNYYYPGTGFKKEMQWGGVWSKTKDWLPIVGKVKDNIHVSICMGDQGITMGFLSGKNMVDSVKGERNMFLDMASPGRFA
ncbi:MAG: FAD-binding oxidoreductase [Candidatus Micrarchaeota archaeon]|nr:FAD-binding oxidoreductase [Candidatus Micrarchaeota archaeon]MDE1823767.1 FAD-binding oxidoreductase [Candidatus Micrarchaeota archaeon]MDE1849564.1 FAD-binding oxidoreductase [Candidatus Micrarchaeota archaeon]